METVRPCGCKGIRSCLFCETEYKIVKVNLKTRFEVRFKKFFTNKTCHHIKLGQSVYLLIYLLLISNIFIRSLNYLIYQPIKTSKWEN